MAPCGPTTLARVALTENTWTANHADGGGGALWAGLVSQFALGGNEHVRQTTAANGSGGAIALSNIDTATFTGPADFSGNTANATGGAVHLDHCSSASFSAVTLTNNTSHQNGGAINAYYTDSLSITGSTFTGNHADWSGGAVQAYFVRQVEITGGSMTGNTAGHGGGGLRLDNCVTTTVSGVQLTQNVAAGNGGAIDSDQNQLIRLIDNTFSGNRSENGSAGAVMLSSLGQGEVTGNNQFLNNYARWDAGAIFIQFAAMVTIDGATVTGNTADRYVGAIEVTNQSHVVMSELHDLPEHGHGIPRGDHRPREIDRHHHREHDRRQPCGGLRRRAGRARQRGHFGGQSLSEQHGRWRRRSDLRARWRIVDDDRQPRVGQRLRWRCGGHRRVGQLHSHDRRQPDRGQFGGRRRGRDQDLHLAGHDRSQRHLQ